MNSSSTTSRAPLAASALALLLATAVPPASAALDLWGAYASGFASECPAGLCSGAVLERDDAGPAQQLSASADLSEPVRLAHPGVDYQVQATLVGDLDLPELKARAFADSALRYSVSTTAKAMQGYLYSGLAPADFTLNVAVNGVITGQGGLSGFVNVYDAARYDPLLPNSSRLANSFFIWTLTSQAQPAPLVFSLDPGDSVYLEAVMFASADSRNAVPSTADAFHTLRLAFSEPPADLLPATQLPVPEPAAATLLALGLAAIRLLRRRGRH